MIETLRPGRVLLVMREALASFDLVRQAARERLAFAVVFLLVTFPWLVWTRVRVREDERVREPPLSPFIYTLQ